MHEQFPGVWVVRVSLALPKLRASCGRPWFAWTWQPKNSRNVRPFVYRSSRIHFLNLPKIRRWFLVSQAHRSARSSPAERIARLCLSSGWRLPVSAVAEHTCDDGAVSLEMFFYFISKNKRRTSIFGLSVCLAKLEQNFRVLKARKLHPIRRV